MTTKLKELEVKVTQLQKEIDKLKGKNWPEENDTYFYLDGGGYIVSTCFVSTFPLDSYRKSVGNTFRTEEEAEVYKEYLLKPFTVARAKLEMYADKHNDEFTLGYYFVCIKENSEIEVSYCIFFLEGIIKFSSREIAQQAIKDLGEELIKTALGYYD